MDFFTSKPMSDGPDPLSNYFDVTMGYPEATREGPVEVMVPGFETFICQYGWCESCGIELAANCKQICCPRCGEPAYLT